MIVALSTWVTVAWWATLGAGLVVALVVWALLEALRRTVARVLAGVEDVLNMGGRLAQNTWTVQLLATTRARGVDVLEELTQDQRNGRSEG